MIRRYGVPPVRGVRYTLRPGAYAILPRGDEMLLTFQEAPHSEFQLPGGGIDPGEGAITALHREVIEETGWSIARPRRLGAFRRFVYMPEYAINAEKLCHIYIAHPVRQVSDPREDGHSAAWMPNATAVAMVSNDGDRAHLAAWCRFAGVPL